MRLSIHNIELICLTVLIKLTACHNPSPPNLGNGYKLDFNHRGGKYLIVNSRNNIIVEGYVLDYSFDSTFIIAAQRPLDSIPECTYKHNETLNDCKEAFEKSTFMQYWIINKKQDGTFDEKTRTRHNVYGPFKMKEYLKKRDEFGVPKTLQLSNRKER